MQRIVKIAENNVAVQTVYFGEKVNGKEVIVHREIYGQQRIDDEVTKTGNRKIALDALDIEVEKAKEDVKLARLAKIQIIMDEQGD